MAGVWLGLVNRCRCGGGGGGDMWVLSCRLQSLYIWVTVW